MTVNNLGMIGNAFSGSFSVEGFPSCEYPRNSGVEHLFQGGLWIGAIKEGRPLVTTGALDDPSGYSTGKSGFEFTASAGSGLESRSSLIDDPEYSPDAVSHEDFVADFTDANVKVPGTDIEIRNHDNPLNVDVHFEAYNWNFNFANFFVILDYTITNSGNTPLDSLHVGYWNDGVIRNVNITPPGGSPFFNKGGNGYIDSLYTGYEFDATGDTNFTKSYIGLKFLGAESKNQFHHREVDDTKVHYNSWQFRNSVDPVFFAPTSDNARYSKLSLGLNQNPNLNWPDIQEDLSKPSNRSNLVTAGAFDQLEPGESIKISFAVVCAKMNQDGNPVSANTAAQRKTLRKNLSWAQRTYNGEDDNFNGQLDPGEDRDNDGEITRYILPAPPTIPTTKMIAKNNKIELYWSDNAESSIDPISKEKDFEGYRIYKSKFGFDVQTNEEALSSMEVIAEYDKKGNEHFYNTGFEKIQLAEPKTFEGDSITYNYKYVIDNIQNGWQHAVALTAFDRGDPENNVQPLESSKIANMKRVFPGTPPVKNLQKDKPFVYPNPYYGAAAWRGNSSFEEDRRIMFANLPKRAKIRIYSPSGDLIDQITHTQNYQGKDAEWYSSFSDAESTKFSGGEHAWDLLSKENQIIARGLYVFSVEDLDTGKQYEGKFVVIK